jgi:hypothetical protein
VQVSPAVRVPAPLDDPLSYPGQRPDTSFVLRGNVLRPLAEVETRVVEGRRAVLAIGSNACPAQLAVKFRDRGCSDVVVGLVVDVDALVVRPSAHFSRSGYWPFAPARLDGGGARCILTLLDDDQVDVLDRTEPNYDRVVLDPGVHRVRVERTPCDASVEVYASRHGVVDDGRLPAFPDAPSSDPLPTQQALISALLRAEGTGLPTTPARVSDRVRQYPDEAEHVTRAIRRLHVRPARLATATATQGECRSGRLPMPSANER